MTSASDENGDPPGSGGIVVVIVENAQPGRDSSLLVGADWEQERRHA